MNLAGITASFRRVSVKAWHEALVLHAPRAAASVTFVAAAIAWRPSNRVSVNVAYPPAATQPADCCESSAASVYL